MAHQNERQMSVTMPCRASFQRQDIARNAHSADSAHRSNLQVRGPLRQAQGSRRTPRGASSETCAIPRRRRSRRSRGPSDLCAVEFRGWSVKRASRVSAPTAVRRPFDGQGRWVLNAEDKAAEHCACGQGAFARLQTVGSASDGDGSPASLGPREFSDHAALCASSTGRA
jgi:hypothetical protein